MHPLIIDPKGPLIFRTGRPFGSTSGDDTFRVAPQSAIAGALRAAYAEQLASDASANFDLASLRNTLPKESMQGPFLAHIDNATHKVTELFFPKPADAAYLPKVCALLPGNAPEGAQSSVPQGLLPVYSTVRAKRARGPAFWSAQTLLTWLSDPKRLEGNALGKDQGRDWLPVDQRVHVGIQRSTQTADNGILFKSSGLDFESLACGEDLGGGFTAHRSALVARFSQTITSTVQRVGADGRLAHIATDHSVQWPQAPDASWKQWTRFRMVLVTPGAYANGMLPGWLDADYQGTFPGTQLTVKLRAVASERWQGVSGWDLAQGSPRPVLRTVPAGAVYWFDVVGGGDAEQLKAAWLQATADITQHYNDGHGLAVFGVWA